MEEEESLGLVLWEDLWRKKKTHGVMGEADLWCYAWRRLVVLWEEDSSNYSSSSKSSRNSQILMVMGSNLDFIGLVLFFFSFFQESVVGVVLIFQKMREEDEEFKWRRWRK